MSGKLLGIIIVSIALIAGAAVYYLQVYAYYGAVSAETAQIRLMPLANEEPEEIIVTEFEGIDADSSPLRFRACFTTPLSQAMLTETYQVYGAAEPLVAPSWFDCFDATEIGEALVRGEAIAFLSERDIADGVDRVVAVFDDGRAFAWHQLNETYRD